MTPRFIRLPPWSLRISLIVAVITLPMIVGAFRAWQSHQQLTAMMFLVFGLTAVKLV